MDASEKPKVIKAFINDMTRTLWDMSADSLSGIMLTGSYAAWLRGDKAHAPSWGALPDVNIYPLTHGNEMNVVKVGKDLKTSIDQTVTKFSGQGASINILLDLHPFSVSPCEFDPKSNAVQLQLTSRAINLDLPESYPPYCWHGWLANHVLLYAKSPDILDGIKYRGALSQDAEWYRNVYLALVSYGNVLQVLPLFTTSRGHLFDEAFRYAKEITKDGFSIPLREEEYANGKSFELLHGWKACCQEFYGERYGSEAAAIVRSFIEIDNDYLAKREAIDPFLLIEKSFRLREILFDVFKEKLANAEEHRLPARLVEGAALQPHRPAGSSTKLPSEAFKSMPLWW